MKRGDIYLAAIRGTGHEVDGDRPVIVINTGVDTLYQNMVTVIPMTTNTAKSPTRVKITKTETGLAKDSYAMIEHIKAIDIDFLRNKYGELTDEQMQEVNDAVCRHLGYQTRSSLAEITESMNETIEMQKRENIKLEAKAEVYKGLYQDLLKEVTGSARG